MCAECGCGQVERFGVHPLQAPPARPVRLVEADTPDHVEHTHEHVHADGTRHSHPHVHGAGHEADHEHPHEPGVHAHTHTHADGTTHSHPHAADDGHAHEHAADAVSYTHLTLPTIYSV